MTPTNPDVIAVLKRIDNAHKKLQKLRDTCVHIKVIYDYNDNWNGYDYPATSTGTTTYICSECGEFIREEKEVRHGF